ncbi:GNAT family N-acetyltransferase [Actinotalea sp. Marseille-Q4924]|uniref:GNAT family N-acetyltransferase n=1 Tax=Actinotalea sp. Marseille-Q4924 TaxID=2866571 RepID=UPI001CE4598D|nr:GNAT family protein [Actinotalea sp. Marseille-Q4924]
MSVSLHPLDVRGADRAALVELLTRNHFPFHVVPRPTVDGVERWIVSGRYDDEDHAASWVDVEGQGRVGLVVLEDLTDDAPLFDLRLAERFRGRGLAAPVLRAVTAHVFATRPRVHRFEGQTREDNVAMRRAFVRCGFVKEAHYRDGWPVEGGDPVASVAYAVLRRDWVSGTTTPVPWSDEP